MGCEMNAEAAWLRDVLGRVRDAIWCRDGDWCTGDCANCTARDIADEALRMRTLRSIRDSAAPLFYEQSWWLDEPFANEIRHGHTAAWMAEKFVADPTDPKWHRFIWTNDIDSHGNRVYVGGVGEFGCDGFQIHRLLEPDERWAEWEDL